MSLHPLAWIEPVFFPGSLFGGAEAIQGVIFSGRPQGFTVMTRRGSWASARAKRYIAWKKFVQAEAARQGWQPERFPGGAGLAIFSQAFFENGVHPDPENVHKGIVDSLFWSMKGGDKQLGGAFGPPQYSKTDPRVEVSIWRLHGQEARR